MDTGNLVNGNSFWKTTGRLVKKIDVPNEDAKCSKKKNKINAFLPIAQLSRKEAVDLCHKFGEGVYIAGHFNDIEDFDIYYEGLMESKKFLEKCTFYDNGRILTWLPYTRNSEKTDLVHDITGESLLYNHDSKFYAYWYEGPSGNTETTVWESGGDLCAAAYFGVLEKYNNIYETSCSTKRCAGCEISNSFERTVKLNLRGLCKQSYFDTEYNIKYDPVNIISYIGIERNIIEFDFEKVQWTIRDVTNPYIIAVSDASKKSMVLGNHPWTVTNDTICAKGKETYTAVLSLTGCTKYQFTCNDGLCISIDYR